eukprot:CAMPEP_0194027948 /NCGR_PEP_ID=MMETSP0009_2-20130614/1983_1 /TAXON_ID=210454 /ORGANISM="Grammatophora oceanica, Strain CCMP 410" /LENGTH=251 /DNA_ID=CAMNT_0038667161 /DNA_START=59 /DNA_END=814 /DNA_ORIENTATION=+
MKPRRISRLGSGRFSSGSVTTKENSFRSLQTERTRPLTPPGAARPCASVDHVISPVSTRSAPFNYDSEEIVGQLEIPSLIAFPDESVQAEKNQVQFTDAKPEPTVFWTSPTALIIFGIAIVALVMREPMVLHGISCLVVFDISRIVLLWVGVGVKDTLLRKCWKETLAWKAYAQYEVKNTTSSRNPFRRPLEGAALMTNQIVGKQTINFVQYRMKKTKAKMMEQQKRQVELLAQARDVVRDKIDVTKMGHF